jgi:hypothetical protein
MIASIISKLSASFLATLTRLLSSCRRNGTVDSYDGQEISTRPPSPFFPSPKELDTSREQNPARAVGFISYIDPTVARTCVGEGSPPGRNATSCGRIKEKDLDMGLGKRFEPVAGESNRDLRKYTAVVNGLLLLSRVLSSLLP